MLVEVDLVLLMDIDLMHLKDISLLMDIASIAISMGMELLSAGQE